MVGSKVTGLEPLSGTQIQKISLTWYWSCFRSQSQACISPADWQRSVARLPAPWSDVQTAAPGETGQREERGLFINCHIGSHPECYIHPVIPATFLLKGGLVWLVWLCHGKTGESLCQFPTLAQNTESWNCDAEASDLWHLLSHYTKQKYRGVSWTKLKNLIVRQTIYPPWLNALVCRSCWDSLGDMWGCLFHEHQMKNNSVAMLISWYSQICGKNLTRYQIIKREAELVNR